MAELDQGLRCGRLGEQSEAIVKFPRLFAKYPFPILINSALLKLADIFRQSSNFIKLCVLRVVQQSERHLDKIFVSARSCSVGPPPSTGTPSRAALGRDSGAAKQLTTTVCLNLLP